MNNFIKLSLFLYFLIQPLFSARYAVLIGNSNGNGNLANLKYVKNDINAIKNILKTNCSFDEANITTIYNKEPLEIKNILKNFKLQVKNKEKDIFLFYYSGHADHNSLIMGKNRYILKELKSDLKMIPSNMKIMIFDACQSGSFARLKGGTVSSPFLIHEENNTEGQIVLYSSSSTEYSQESDYYRQSIFSFHLVNALKGCADESGDKLVTLNEAYQYAYNQTVSSTINSAGGIQHPGYLLNIQGKGNVILADMRSKHNGIVLDKSVKGSIAVLDNQNNIISDIIKKENNEIFLALNSGKFHIYNNDNQKTSRAKVQLTGSTIHHLKGDQFKPVRSIPIYTKGGAAKKTTISLITQGGFSLIDHSPLSSSLEKNYRSFNYYNINPKLPLSSEQWLLGGGLEVSFTNGLFIYNGYNFNKISSESTFNGFSSPPEDTTKYSVTLSINNTLQVHEINLGLGYNFKHTVLRFFSIATGFDLLIPKLITNSNFKDMLYQTIAHNENIEKGILILPSIQFRLEYPVTPILSLGTSFKYRLQYDSKQLNSEMETSDYDFKGLSGLLRIKLNLNGR